MKMRNAVVAAFLLLGFARGVLAEKPENTPAALEKKLHRVWKGLSACQGDLILRANGSFEKPHCGPGDVTFKGTWEVHWDALPPTLVMNCQSSTDPTAAGKKDEVKLIILDDSSLVIASPPNDFQWRYRAVALTSEGGKTPTRKPR